MKYQIESKAGYVIGQYYGECKEDALRAMYCDAGYDLNLGDEEFQPELWIIHPIEEEE